VNSPYDRYCFGGNSNAISPAAKRGEKLLVQNPFKSEFISGFKLSEHEKQDLIAFLQSLTDETFISNRAFSNPQDENLAK
jgi:cytochrome c peroxidase